jgi:hypothetical protein
MLDEPTCFTRRCKHFFGAIGEEDEGQWIFCAAFPDGDGIPEEIAYGKNKHLTPLAGQLNEITYEKE